MILNNLGKSAKLAEGDRLNWVLFFFGVQTLSRMHLDADPTPLAIKCSEVLCLWSKIRSSWACTTKTIAPWCSINLIALRLLFANPKL